MKKSATEREYQSFSIYEHELKFMEAIKAECEKPGRRIEDIVSAGFFESLARNPIGGRTLADFKGPRGKEKQVAATLWIYVERHESKRTGQNRQDAPKRRRAAAGAVRTGKRGA